MSFDYNGVEHQFTGSGRTRKTAVERNAYTSVWDDNFCCEYINI